MRIAIFINTAWNIYNFRSGLIRTLQKEGHEIHAIAPEDSYSVRLTAMGCIYHPIRMNNTGNNPWDELSLIHQLFRLYKDLKPQVALHYTIKPNIYGSLVARLLRIPSICTVSGLGTVFLTNSKSNSVARMLYSVAFRYPQRIFFHNTADMEIFKLQHLLKADNYSLVPGSGIDIRRFIRRQSTPETPPFIFLMVSRLIEEKGVREFMKASEILKAQGLELKCQILGPPERNHRRSVSLEELASSSVTYLGETDDVKDFITKSHAIVLPSFREGLSRSLLEAAAMEKPIITCNVPGCTEVVKDQINGLLCTPGDPHDLALKMKEMLSYSKEKLAEMGRAGRKLVEQRYTEDQVNAYYLEVINKTNNTP